jgi:hypothetical protein
MTMTDTPWGGQYTLLNKYPFIFFLICNTMAFSSSIYLLLYLTFGNPFFLEVLVATLSMSGTYADLQTCGGNSTGGGEEGRRDLVEEKTTTFSVFFKKILIFNLIRAIL